MIFLILKEFLSQHQNGIKAFIRIMEQMEYRIMSMITSLMMNWFCWQKTEDILAQKLNLLRIAFQENAG